MLQANELANLQEIADQNDGRCDRCNRVIKIYKYRINKPLAQILMAMREAVEVNGTNEVNFNKLDIPYSMATQRTKLRLHGLIAKVKDDKGQHKGGMWLITKKGGEFLKGEPIPEKVVVFDNQVLGHDGGLVSIKQVLDDYNSYEQKKISTPEAKVYSDVKTPKKNYECKAEWNGPDTGSYFAGQVYNLTLLALQFGKPVVMMRPWEETYPDIAAFQKHWKVVE